MLLALAQTIVAPLLLGALLRAAVAPLRRAVDANRPTVRALSSALLIATPWMSISVSAASGELATLGAPALLAVLRWAAAVHGLLLLGNSAAMLLLGVGGRGCGAPLPACLLVARPAPRRLPIPPAALPTDGPYCLLLPPAALSAR